MINTTEIFSLESVLKVYDTDGNLINNVKSIEATTNETNYYETVEGKKKIVIHYEKERDQSFMKICKNLHLKNDPFLSCEVCGFSFIKKYGDIGKNYIEGHHTKPISELDDDTIISTDDIKMVCSNCHSMIHSKKPWLSIDQLKSILLASSSVT